MNQIEITVSSSEQFITIFLYPVNRKNAKIYSAMKKYILISTVILFSMFIFAQQTRAQEFNWSELKQTQKEEKIFTENRQKEEILNLREMQKLELQKSIASDFSEITTKHKSERLELAKIHADERTKLTQTHADERINFTRNAKFLNNR